MFTSFTSQQQIIVIFLPILVILLFVMYFLSGKTVNNPARVNINPSTTYMKNDCSSVRTPCDKTDRSSCSASCNNTEEMTCVDMDDGSGSFCLPSNVKTPCNLENGGIRVWTGYGFTEEQGWSCLCSHPEYFSGPSCDTVTPSFCTNGNLDMSPSKKFTDDMCTCPDGTEKMYREYGNTPFCATIKKDSPINYIGNYVAYPNWQNVFYNPKPKAQDYSDWAKAIANEMYGNTDKIQPILAYLNKFTTPKVLQLTTEMVNGLSDAFKDGNLRADSFHPEKYLKEVRFSYYDNNFTK
jgi:hypothetical protein